MLLFLFFYLLSLNALETSIKLLPHGFTTHTSFSLRSTDPSALVEMEYTNAQSNNLLWLWTRFSCSGRMDVLQKISCSGEAGCENGWEYKTYQTNIPIQLSRKGNDYRVLVFRKDDCGDDRCILVFHITVSYMCAIDIYVERGKFLNFGSNYVFKEEYYKWGNSTSDLQLYAVQPSLDDFPLSVSVQWSTPTWCELQHAWGLDATVYKSLHHSSFLVAIPSREGFTYGQLVYFWVGVIDRQQYLIEIDRSEFFDDSGFVSNGLNILILGCLGFVIFIGTCCRWAYRERATGDMTFNPREGVRQSITQEELKDLEKFEWNDKHVELGMDGTCSICFEEYEKDDTIRLLPCQHYFHCGCIDRWLTERKRNCPLCQQDVGEAVNFHKSPPISPRAEGIGVKETEVPELVLDGAATKEESGQDNSNSAPSIVELSLNSSNNSNPE